MRMYLSPMLMRTNKRMYHNWFCKRLMTFFFLTKTIRERGSQRFNRAEFCYDRHNPKKISLKNVLDPSRCPPIDCKQNSKIIFFGKIWKYWVSNKKTVWTKCPFFTVKNTKSNKHNFLLSVATRAFMTINSIGVLQHTLRAAPILKIPTPGNRTWEKSDHAKHAETLRESRSDDWSVSGWANPVTARSLLCGALWQDLLSLSWSLLLL